MINKEHFLKKYALNIYISLKTAGVGVEDHEQYSEPGTGCRVDHG